MRRARTSVAAGMGRARGLRALPLSLFAASCVPMLVMLPAGVTGVLASLGVQGRGRLGAGDRRPARADRPAAARRLDYLHAPVLGWGSATASLHARHLPEAQAPASERAAPLVRVGRDAFSWSGRVESYTSKRPWFPPISTNGALLRIQGQLRAGHLYVQLMDGRAVVLWERTFRRIPPGGVRVEAPGARGVWTVTLGFRRFSSRVNVELGRLATR